MLDEARFADISVAELAREAGLRRASFYFYFDSKQALLAAVVSEAVAELNPQVSADVADNAGRSPEELVAATLAPLPICGGSTAGRWWPGSSWP